MVAFEDLKIGQVVKIGFDEDNYFGEIVHLSTRRVGIIHDMQSFSYSAARFLNSWFYNLKYIPKFKLMQFGFGDYFNYLNNLEIINGIEF